MGRRAVLVLLDSAEQGQLMTARPMGYRTSAHDAVTLSSAPKPEEVRYLECPMCDDQMLRTRFLAEDAAVADVCVLHAVWFDVGELERAVAGLARAGPDCREALRPLIADHFRGGPPPEGDGAS